MTPPLPREPTKARPRFECMSTARACDVDNLFPREKRPHAYFDCKSMLMKYLYPATDICSATRSEACRPLSR